MIARFLLMLAIILGLAAPITAFAADPFAQVDCSKASDSTVCKTKGQTDNPLTGPSGVITMATNVIAVIAGAVAVIFIILGGISYITSNGDASQVSKAKTSIIYSLVGLILVILARSIIGLVVNKI